MKSIILATIMLTTSVYATSALADDAPPLNAGFERTYGELPAGGASGYQIAGCTYRRIGTGEQVCDPKSTEVTLKDGLSAQNYVTVFGVTSTGGD